MNIFSDLYQGLRVWLGILKRASIPEHFFAFSISCYAYIQVALSGSILLYLFLLTLMYYVRQICIASFQQDPDPRPSEMVRSLPLERGGT